MNFFTTISSKAKKITGDIQDWQKNRDIERNRRILEEYEREKKRAHFRAVRLKTEKLKSKHVLPQKQCNMFSMPTPNMVEETKQKPRKKSIPRLAPCLHKFIWSGKHRLWICKYCGKIKQQRFK